jgi:periplasmic copper chaperone A
MSRTRAFRRVMLTGAALTLSATGLAACGGSSDSGGAAGGPLAVNDSWTKATEGPMTGSFGTLVNSTGEDITVTGGSSPVAGMVELHEVVMADGEMVMQEKPGGFVIPAGGSLTLEPGGNHVMLMGLTGAIAPGQDVPITLSLSNGETITYTTVAKDFAGGNESYEPSPSMSMSMG